MNVKAFVCADFSMVEFELIDQLLDDEVVLAIGWLLGGDTQQLPYVVAIFVH